MVICMVLNLHRNLIGQIKTTLPGSIISKYTQRFNANIGVGELGSRAWSAINERDAVLVADLGTRSAAFTFAFVDNDYGLPSPPAKAKVSRMLRD